MNILEKDGLDISLLNELSHPSELDYNLKQNLHYFDRTALLNEVSGVLDWYDMIINDYDICIDYRIKSFQSAVLKYERYYPDHQARKVFNDLLGFRSLCDSYNDVLLMQDINEIKFVDMSNGKANDDGYRGIHVYYQKDNRHYPIEIQYNTYYDRQLNNWLHLYLYKKGYPNKVGQIMREQYECGNIHNEKDFEEVLNNVLSGC